MAIQSTMVRKFSITFILFVLAIMSKTAISQNCGCAPNLCCSKHGYCGEGNDYCGEGCREGPCQSSGGGGGGSSGGGGSESLESIVTPDFFNSIINQADASCAGKRFYTRDAFLSAAKSYSDFSNSISKREVAAFFAHITHETGYLCHTEEQGQEASKDFCDVSTPESKQYPCAQGKKYFGRGPLQLSWNYNYGPCGKDLGVDLLGSPETVATDPAVAFKAAFWFWTKKVRPVFGQGFGATIKAINGGEECNGRRSQEVQARIGFFKDYCGKFGVDPGADLSC